MRIIISGITTASGGAISRSIIPTSPPSESVSRCTRETLKPPGNVAMNCSPSGQATSIKRRWQCKTPQSRSGHFTRFERHRSLRRLRKNGDRGTHLAAGTGGTSGTQVWHLPMKHAQKKKNGALERTRTFTPLGAQPPQGCVSTNSTTSAPDW